MEIPRLSPIEGEGEARRETHHANADYVSQSVLKREVRGTSDRLDIHLLLSGALDTNLLSNVDYYGGMQRGCVEMVPLET